MPASVEDAQSEAALPSPKLGYSKLSLKLALVALTFLSIGASAQEAAPGRSSGVRFHAGSYAHFDDDKVATSASTDKTNVNSAKPGVLGDYNTASGGPYVAENGGTPHSKLPPAATWGSLLIRDGVLASNHAGRAEEGEAVDLGAGRLAEQ